MKNKALNVNDMAGLNILDLIDALPFYLLVIDEYHNILLANKAVRTNLGLEPEEIVGMYCPKAVHGIDTPFPGCPLEEAVEKGRPVEREYLDVKSGHWIRSVVYPTNIVTRDSRKVYLHWVIDISDRKKAEEELRDSRDRMRILSQHLETVREEEKKKIANDLHDETSQVATSLNTYLEAAISKLPPHSEEVKALLRKAQDFSEQIHDELHRIIYELRPSILDDFGLVAALTWLTKNTLEPAGMQVTFKVSRQEKNLSPDLRIALFRVVQESINNILKHANAKNVTIILSFNRNAIKIGIKDDGAGFDLAEVMKGKNGVHGMGIAGMKERVELFQGIFDINSKPGEGTEIKIEIPLEQATMAKTK